MNRQVSLVGSLSVPVVCLGFGFTLHKLLVQGEGGGLLGVVVERAVS